TSGAFVRTLSNVRMISIFLQDTDGLFLNLFVLIVQGKLRSSAFKEAPFRTIKTKQPRGIFVQWNAINLVFVVLFKLFKLPIIAINPRLRHRTRKIHLRVAIAIKLVVEPFSGYIFAVKLSRFRIPR